MRGKRAQRLGLLDPVIEAWCIELGIQLPVVAADEAGISENHAARFVLHTLATNRWARWRFRRALSEGASGGFARWLINHRKFALAESAQKKIRGAFRRPPGRRILEIYLHDPELQRLYPHGLIPGGQRGFLQWLTSHGRIDQGVQDHEILWFVRETAEAPAKALALTFRVQPAWQAQFPDALMPEGWPVFVKAVQARHPELQIRSCPLPPAEKQQLPSGAGGANILSHFCYPSGIQQAALWTKTAFERCGHETSCRDVPAGVATVPGAREPWLGLERFPVTISNVAPTPWFPTMYERAGLLRREDVYRIGYWAWELERVPEAWVEIARRVDEIWAPTEFVAAAFKALPVPVKIMPPGVEAGPVAPVSRAECGIGEDDFVFLFLFDMFSDFERKNPLAVIRAYREAFGTGKGTRLLIKVNHPHADPAAFARLANAAADTGAHVVAETYARERTFGLLEMCDCFVSLHRSEGFGLGLAEAMLLGKPAIGTAYSGNLSFMNDGNSHLVPYELVPVRGASVLYQAGGQWAEPSIEHAAAIMRQVAENREEARRLGARAQAELREKLSLEAAGKRMIARLKEIEINV